MIPAKLDFIKSCGYLLNSGMRSSFNRFNDEANNGDTLAIADEKAYEQIALFTSTSANQQDVVTKAVADIVDLCRDYSPTILKSYYKISVQHIIKEYIEVLSWQERNPDGATILYYDTKLPDFMKFIPQKSAHLNSTYFPERTVIFEKICLHASYYKASVFNGKKTDTRELRKDMFKDPKKIKVYYPICYGYPKKINLECFQFIRNYFLGNMQIPPENIL